MRQKTKKGNTGFPVFPLSVKLRSVKKKCSNSLEFKAE